MTKTYKFRLYPSKEIEQKMLNTLDLCRQTYNELLGLLNNQNVIDKSQIQGIIPDMKICEPKFKQLYAKTMQYECYRLFSNLSKLAKTKKKGRKVGALRFKGKNWFKTFTYNQFGFKIINNGKRYQTLHLSKIGDIPIRCHRNIKGKIKQITIKHEPSGKWFASIAEETIIPKQITKIKKVVGLDLGLINEVYDSDNNKVLNPKYLKQYEKRIAFLNKKFSKKSKGSNNKNKYRIRLTKQYEKLANARNDFLHKTSRYYVDNYDVIGIEDMLINNMLNREYSKSILDASWGKLRQYISYKAESAGKIYLPVDYRGTTQRCNNCQETVKKEIWQRTHQCPFCGINIPRDYNSALEIRNLTVKKIRQELPESTLVEMEGYRSIDQCPSMNQEAISSTAKAVRL
jgi:putative transposase